MTFQTLGDKREFISTRVRNAEASATISRGMPVVLAINATEDGLAVVLPSSKNAAQAILFKFGVALDDITAGQLGNVQNWGVCNYVALVRQTRGASTDVWATQQTLGLSVGLAINTVNNFLSSISDSTATQASNAAVSLTDALIAAAFMAQTLASFASSASSTADSRTAITVGVKAFLRMM